MLLYLALFHPAFAKEFSQALGDIFTKSSRDSPAFSRERFRETARTVLFAAPHYILCRGRKPKETQPALHPSGSAYLGSGCWRVINPLPLIFIKREGKGEKSTLSLTAIRDLSLLIFRNEL